MLSGYIALLFHKYLCSIKFYIITILCFTSLIRLQSSVRAPIYKYDITYKLLEYKLYNVGRHTQMKGWNGKGFAFFFCLLINVQHCDLHYC